ncbi:putative molybdenum transport system permease protein YvgM [Paenibacillus baekrokdamisoli]|uniref:Molybdenum transport system permease n=1 Tax=Paenibacillus baekrokdamisoli TaxID=1712516 RepID=A0A3G9J073_9BACL|nr:molybdate ABC transporter permease subunit [Paenibacillus baekrokdamisoli]MBB3071862.1 molybdate transport system permease protein [Paenibacillus baekrokdamisoli]BBH24156.1 putative molybdenum transport system permease protein YvgM [Paenibacillus baekrokdamisoli]
MDWKTFLEPIALSIKISMVASLIVLVIAVFFAWRMAHARFVGKSIVDTILLLPLVLPPTVIGFLLLVALGRRSWIGRLYDWLVGSQIVFTWEAAIIAAVVVAFPLAYRSMRLGFEGVDRELEDSARALGATEWQVFRYISVPLAARSLWAGYILGFARGLGEFGATLMVAGNIPGKTQTIPTAIYVAIDGGSMQLAWAWSGAMVFFSFLMLLLANRFTKV